MRTRSRKGILAPLLLALVVGIVAGPQHQLAAAEPAVVWSPPDVGALPRDRHGESVRLGRDIFSATYAQIGPGVADPAKRYAGNNLACGNCHLQAGTKRFGLPVYGLAKDFPQYSTRSGVEITLADRVNACMQRSMNGRPLPPDSPELAAVVAYLGYLSTGRPDGYSGYGAGNMPELDRPADPSRGAAAYQTQCTLCHASNGEGVLRAPGVPALGYMIPPLWGDDSFNSGAGMNRLITAANFLHSNMPHGADFANPALSVDEAWDIAAFVLSRQRPTERGQAADFPDLLTKPVDTPYGPYADGFPVAQHTYGPWAPIRAELQRIKAQRGVVENPTVR